MSLRAIPRYVPERSLPARAYLPRQPGARRPDTGPAAAPPGPDWPAGWRACREYLWGVDLYNHGYGWEAHEAWEPLWLALPRGVPERPFLQGLIQCAAAQVKARAGSFSGARRLAVRGTDNLDRAAGAVPAGGPYCLGVDARAFAAAVRAWARDLDSPAAPGQPAVSHGWPLLVLDE